jgi:hypothetical protein
MQTGDAARARRDEITRVGAWGLLLYGVVGVVLTLRLPSLVWEALRAWTGPRSATDAPDYFGWLNFLYEHFDARPWLPWAAWLAGSALLLWTRKRPAPPPTDFKSEPAPDPTPAARKWLHLAVLAALLAVALFGRLAVLVPPDRGISHLPYDDEGVNAGASQLLVQGIMPYRDYFFAHPPLASATYAPSMFYRFNEWGSPTTFMNARYLSVAYGLLTLAALFFAGSRLAGLWGGGIAAALWAIDGRVVEINRKVMLDTPMTLFAAGALALYLWWRVGRAEMGARGRWVLAGAGVLAALALMTKITGVTVLLAIVADLVWGRIGGEVRLRPALLPLIAGFGGASLLVALPFFAFAPGEMLRQVFFFQLLRPSDGIADVPARIADLTAMLGNALTAVFAGLGLLVLTLWLGRGPRAIVEAGDHLRVFRVVVLWLFFSLFVFTFSRSFYPHYYIQLAAPLCLIGAGVGLLARWGSSRDGLAAQRWSRGLAPLVPLVLALPLGIGAWRWIVERREDRIFEIVARYANNAVPPGTPVLSTDQQFNLLAARPPSRNETGYLVDSYGHMIYLGLDMPSRSWGSLFSDLFGGARSNDAYAVMHRPAPQSDFLDRANNVPLIVIHDRGFARLTDATLAQLAAIANTEVEEERYTVYRR